MGFCDRAFWARTISAWDGVPAVAIRRDPVCGSRSRRVKNVGEFLAAGDAGNVGGVGGPAEAAKDFVDARLGGLAQRREGKASIAEVVGDEGADAAGVGDDRDAGGGRGRSVGHEMGRLDEVVVVLTAGDAELAEDGVVDFVGAGEGCRMGTGCL